MSGPGLTRRRWYVVVLLVEAPAAGNRGEFTPTSVRPDFSNYAVAW